MIGRVGRMGQGARAVIAGGRRLATALVDALLPLRCAGCGEIVAARGLCGECWSGLTFIEAPYCVCCGLPFAFAAGDALTCAACLARPPVFMRARAALAYDDASRKLVLGFKHGDRTESAPVLARLMLRSAATLLE